jgi:hypothetical protein
VLRLTKGSSETFAKAFEGGRRGGLPGPRPGADRAHPDVPRDPLSTPCPGPSTGHRETSAGGSRRALAGVHDGVCEAFANRVVGRRPGVRRALPEDVRREPAAVEMQVALEAGFGHPRGPRGGLPRVSSRRSLEPRRSGWRRLLAVAAGRPARGRDERPPRGLNGVSRIGVESPQRRPQAFWPPARIPDALVRL